MFVSLDSYLVSTLLGSCVSVCLFDTNKLVGGINHYMLPYWNGAGLASAKFGNIAISKLIDDLTNQGCSKTNLVAKVFGGANQANFTMRIGDRNVDVAKEILQSHNIKIIAINTGGNLGRKIIFNTTTGKVQMKLLSKSAIPVSKV
ncbi:MAG: chemotaxis protein CheD [Cytophagales bacterium]|nr:chemotaxis protein CheD [Cytophagales bacterium]